MAMYSYTGQNSQDKILPMRAGDETSENYVSEQKVLRGKQLEGMD